MCYIWHMLWNICITNIVYLLSTGSLLSLYLSSFVNFSFTLFYLFSFRVVSNWPTWTTPGIRLDHRLNHRAIMVETTVVSTSLKLPLIIIYTVLRTSLIEHMKSLSYNKLNSNICKGTSKDPISFCILEKLKEF